MRERYVYVFVCRKSSQFRHLGELPGSSGAVNLLQLRSVKLLRWHARNDTPRRTNTYVCLWTVSVQMLIHVDAGHI